MWRGRARTNPGASDARATCHTGTHSCPYPRADRRAAHRRAHPCASAEAMEAARETQRKLPQPNHLGLWRPGAWRDCGGWAARGQNLQPGADAQHSCVVTQQAARFLTRWSHHGSDHWPRRGNPTGCQHRRGRAHLASASASADGELFAGWWHAGSAHGGSQCVLVGCHQRSVDQDFERL